MWPPYPAKLTPRQLGMGLGRRLMWLEVGEGRHRRPRLAISPRPRLGMRPRRLRSLRRTASRQSLSHRCSRALLPLKGIKAAVAAARARGLELGSYGRDGLAPHNPAARA